MPVHFELPNGGPNVRDGSTLRGRTYTPGFSDALGVRRVAHGSPGEPPLEVLEITPAIADSPGFERALRARVDALRDVNQLSLASAYAVERPPGHGLCLVADHVAGRRLSELGPGEWGGALALDLIHTVTPVLDALNHSGVGIAHGALSANRVVVATDSRLVVVEHVLGWAIESLRFPRARLNELGIVVPGGYEPLRFDGRTDMVQLGFLALSLWLRRPLDPVDCPDKVAELLDEAVAADDSPVFAAKMHVWLARALQIGSTPFKSPQDGIDAFDELPGENPWSAGSLDPASSAFPGSKDPGLHFSEDPALHREDPALHLREEDPALHPDEFNVANLRAAIEQRHATTDAGAAPARRLSRRTMWLLAALAVIAMGEAVAVVLVAYGRSLPNVTAAPLAEPQVPVPASLDPQPATVAAAERAAEPVPVPPARPATASVGGLTIASPIELQIIADGKPLGSNTSPIALREGTHRLELVNDTLGFRQTQVVTVDHGQMTVVTIAIPHGRISLNATPWAEVTVDGEVVGETPIANLSLPAGLHEIVFRHPELGERRQSVMIKVGAHVRVTQTFDREPGGGAR